MINIISKEITIEENTKLKEKIDYLNDKSDNNKEIFLKSFHAIIIAINTSIINIY